MIRRVSVRATALLSTALLIACAAASLPGRADGILEEIVVTAQKRSENLQDVPLSISALDAEALEAGRVNFYVLVCLAGIPAILLAIYVTRLSFFRQAPQADPAQRGGRSR